MKNSVIYFFTGDISQIMNTRAIFQDSFTYADISHTPTFHIPRHQVKTLSMEAAGCFWCVDMLKSALSNVSVCERFQTPVDCVGKQAESAEKGVGRKFAQFCPILNSNRGVQCTQKLHVHVDFYTQKIVFENTVNISQNERLSQRQHPRNIASNHVCTTQLAPPLRDNMSHLARKATGQRFIYFSE